MKFKVVKILLLLCIVVSVESFISELVCKIRWGIEENWDLCMRKTNTTKLDITPWTEVSPTVSKARNCLRLCVQQRLCPPDGAKSVPFVLKKMLYQCTYDHDFIP